MFEYASHESLMKGRVELVVFESDKKKGLVGGERKEGSFHKQVSDRANEILLQLQK